KRRRGLVHETPQGSRMRTIEPGSREWASSGRTRKQLERARAARSPEPCQATNSTSGSLPAGAVKVQAAGRKRVRPALACREGLSAMRARAKCGAGSRLPASAARTGAAKSRKVTAEETGLPGRPKNGRLFLEPGDLEERPSGAKARLVLLALSARLKSCPFKTLLLKSCPFEMRPLKSCPFETTPLSEARKARKGAGLRGKSPKTRGLPGWMLTPVKRKRAPMRARAGSTRSNLPAETPPVMSSRSAFMAWESEESRARASSDALGRSHGSPPAATTIAASMGPFELRIWPGAGIDFTGTISSPV